MAKPKRYLGKAVMEFDMWVEFNASDIPAGMDEYDYAVADFHLFFTSTYFSR